MTLNSHQTGRTLGTKGESATVSTNFGNFQADPFYDVDPTNNFFLIDFKYMSAKNENLDLGAMANSSGQVTGISKLQIAGNKTSPFASSAMIELGFNPMLLLFSGNFLYNGSLSLPTSYHPHPKWAISITPRYGYISALGSKNSPWERSISIPGYSAALFYGQEYQISLEYSSFTPGGPYQFQTTPIWSLGFTWRLHYRPEHDSERVRKDLSKRKR